MSILREWVNNYLQNTEHHMYRNHCEKFLTYIESIDKGDRPRDIKKEDLVASVGYYNSVGKINTVSTMTNHLEAIKSFYETVQKEGKADNIFNDISEYDGFKQSIVKRYSLDDKLEREYLSNEVVVKILEYFEENKSDRKLDLIRIFVKLTLIAPAKRQVIAELKFKDFNNDFRSVIVNGVCINISNSLRRDILEAIKGNKYQIEDECRIFEYLYKGKYTHNIFNRPLYKVLEAIDYDVPVGKDTFSVETVMNSAIVTMIKNNVNPLLIAKINGVSIATIGEKTNKLGIEVNNYNELINNAIIKSDYYKFI